MRSGPIIHGCLLVIALLVAYQTSTRSDDKKPTRGAHEVWKMSKVVAIHLESETKTLKIESRSDKQGAYLWGREDRTRKVSPPAKTPQEDGLPEEPAAPEALAEPAPEEIVVTTREFPIGIAGDALLKDFESLMALRKIGTLTPEQLEEYELNENTVNLTVLGPGKEQRTLLLAAKAIYGGTDRYALDVESNTGFVLSGKLVQPLDSAETSLGLKQKHLYKEEEVHSVEVKTTAGDKLIIKGSTTDEKGEHTIWSDSTKPGENDQTLATFIDRVGKLQPSQYEPSLAPSDLLHVATLRYLDADQNSKGYLEIYRQLPSMQKADPKPDAPEPVTQYYIKTERTRVPGKVSRLSAERVDQDLVTLFGIAPPPDPPAPKKARKASSHGSHSHGGAPGEGAPPSPPGAAPPGVSPSPAAVPAPKPASPVAVPAPKPASPVAVPAPKPASPAAVPAPKPAPSP